jgi:hypothetical protein
MKHNYLAPVTAFKIHVFFLGITVCVSLGLMTTGGTQQCLGKNSVSLVSFL